MWGVVSGGQGKSEVQEIYSWAGLEVYKRQREQDYLVAVREGHVEEWLEEEPAVVGLNEINETTSEKLQNIFRQRHDLRARTNDTDTLGGSSP